MPDVRLIDSVKDEVCHQLTRKVDQGAVPDLINACGDSVYTLVLSSVVRDNDNTYNIEESPQVNLSRVSFIDIPRAVSRLRLPNLPRIIRIK